MGQEEENKTRSGKCTALYLLPLSAWERFYLRLHLSNRVTVLAHSWDL